MRASSTEHPIFRPRRIADAVRANRGRMTPQIEIVSRGETAFQSRIKRSIDLVVATIGLIVVLPLLLVLALLIRIDSAGPILFRQRRLGLGGCEFLLFKFRTMRPDAEQVIANLEGLNESAGGVLFKIRNDPRVTRIGRFLRRTSLDELPQLINVIRGDMSLVGPRPLQLRDCDRLRNVDPEGFAQRLAVPQGLTGPWQISGRSNKDSQSMLRLDLHYAEHWSLAMDLKILLHTVPAVLICRGAC